MRLYRDEAFDCQIAGVRTGKQVRPNLSQWRRWNMREWSQEELAFFRALQREI